MDMTGDPFRQLGNKYTLQSLIGVGGMAEVYKAKLSGAEGFEKCVVIKKLFPQFAKDPEIVRHFIAEAKLAALLQHEHIAQVYDFGELDGSYFIAMEYLAGRDLHSVIQRAREMNLHLDLPQALFITARVCEGMEYAHTRKDQHQQPLHLIHRDLSPHNVIITWEGRVKIIDFGIARADLFDNKTQVGMAKGKISYMSPEQLGAEQVDHRSDIFAIGILLYEMLSGRRMYTGDTATLIRKCMAVEYERLESVRPGLPPAIYAILDRALARDVACRYQRCAEMLAEIEEVLFSIERRPGAHLLETFMGGLFADQMEERPMSRSDACQATVLLPLGEESLPPATDGGEKDGESQTVNSSGQTTDPDGNGDMNYAPSAAAHPPVRFVGRKIWAAAGTAVVGAALLLAWQHQSEKPQEPLPAAVPVVAETVQQGPEATVDQQQPVAAASTESVEPVNQPESPVPPSEPSGMAEEEPPDEISALLDQAGELLGNTPITLANLDQAQELYNQVQEKEPDNWEAQAGIARIGDFRRQVAEETMKGGSFARTSDKHAKGMFSAPKDDRFLSLQGVVGEQRQKTVKELLANAKQAMAANRLTTPRGVSAYHFYREVLALESQNAAALQGLAAIADRYAEMADAAFREMRLPTANKYCRQGLAVDPQNPRLRELQRDLAKSKPAMFLRSIERSFKASPQAGDSMRVVGNDESTK